MEVKYIVDGDQTQVTRVTGGNTYHYTTTTQSFSIFNVYLLKSTKMY